jgi:hypothetical protein
MKKLGWLVVALIVVCASWAGAVNKYEIKSGIVTLEYVMTIGKTVIKMTKIVYFDDYGSKECEETYTDGKLGSVLFCDGKDRYSLQTAKKKASKGESCTNGIGMRIDINDMGTKKDIEAGVVKKIAPMTLAGQKCEVIQVTKGKEVDLYAGWNKVMVYMKTGSKDMTTEIKAVKLEANAVVPKDKFQVPAGYTLK